MIYDHYNIISITIIILQQRQAALPHLTQCETSFIYLFTYKIIVTSVTGVSNSISDISAH